MRYWREIDYGPWWQNLGGHFVDIAYDVQVWREVSTKKTCTKALETGFAIGAT
jgi:hypothetical protein